ncbi:CHRD domain-containing protein [Stakelama marina]|uniref:CHRD domain-containing protein n=1 Tax=Stakelama marina TaxID=2826939 RepID=A0A8T4IGF7_9SPHN|nr:CHRD domain-containing protein [Stakelama marina]MBR0553640.1 CHRD domain-containing protein [Stakelama marina]
MSVRPVLAATAALSATAALLGGCATISQTVGKTWTMGLIGAQEVPGPGDPDGSGTAKVTADATTGTICYELTVQDISQPTAAHIHQGARGVAGPPVLQLKPPVTGSSKECLDVDKQLAAAIIANPTGYYVNVHTADYPKGAIRGQLPPR